MNHLADGSLEEGDTVQLEDGTTAYIQQVTVQQKGQQLLSTNAEAGFGTPVHEAPLSCRF